MSEKNQHYDVIVIGSGIGGLTAATKASQFGYKVLMLEAGKAFGGYINPFKRSGFDFSPGLHYVGECGPNGRFAALLDDLGLNVEFEEMNPDGFDQYHFPGYAFHMPKGLDCFRDRLIRDFPQEKKGIDQIISILRKTMNTVRHIQRFQGLSSLVEILPAVMKIFPWRKATFGELLDHHVNDPMLKSVFSAMCGNAGLPPSRLSAIMHLLILGHYLNGAYVPVGGTRSIRDEFLSILKKQGVEMKRNAPVEKILSENGRITGVKTMKGEHYSSRAVISNAQGAATFSMLDEGAKLPYKLRQKNESMCSSLGSLMIFMGLKRGVDLSKVKDHNIWHYSTTIEDSYKDHFDEKLPAPNSFFIHSPTGKDARGNIAPEGHDSLEMVTLCSPKPFQKYFGQPSMKREAGYLELKEKISHDYVKAMEAYVPDLSKSIEIKEVSTPATNHSYTLSPDGNIYGPEQTPKQMLLGRYFPKTSIQGLYLCGSSVLSCGVTPAAASGEIAAKIAHRHLQKR